jgi:hypothetical protein
VLVSADELISYMSGVNLTAPQRAEAERTLSGVQQELETYCNRPLELVQIREVVRADWQGMANLSISPVWKIISNYSLDQLDHGINVFTPYIPPPMERDPLIDEVTGRPLVDMLTTPNVGEPMIIPGAMVVDLPTAYYVVEYIGGWNGYTINGLKQAIKRVAAREMEGQHDNTLSLRQGNAEAAAPGDSRPKGWTQEELQQFDRYRRRVIV